MEMVKVSTFRYSSRITTIAYINIGIRENGLTTQEQLLQKLVKIFPGSMKSVGFRKSRGVRG